MQGFELAAISVPPSDFHNFFEVATGHRRNAGNRAGGHFPSSLFSLFSAPSSLLSSALDSRNRIPAFLQGIMRPRGLPPCRNAAIRDGPGANKPCCQSIWGSLAAFFVISSLFSRLASLAAARPGKVQTLLQYSSCFNKGLPASLCALPSSLLGPDPFLYHPALLGPNHLSSLFSLLFSLFSRCCSFPRSHLATATSICASGHRLRAKLLRPFAAPSLARRNARSD